jgi:hypothetical protein
LFHSFFPHLLLVFDDELCGQFIDVAGLGQAVLADASQELFVGVDDSSLFEGLHYVTRRIRCSRAVYF